MFLLINYSKIWGKFKFKIKTHSFKLEQKSVAIIFSIMFLLSFGDSFI